MSPADLAPVGMDVGSASGALTELTICRNKRHRLFATRLLAVHARFEASSSAHDRLNG